MRTMATSPIPTSRRPSSRTARRSSPSSPAGVEAIPEGERHGRPLQLLWTWASPNFEFATIAVGILSVLAFGLTFWQAVAAIVLGTLLGSVSLGVLSTWGPRDGLAQMVLSRTAFGYRGNILPAGLNALTAGIGWFAVNSISGALALTPSPGCPRSSAWSSSSLAQLVIAFFGHNLVHAFERYAFPVLAIIFVVGGGHRAVAGEPLGPRAERRAAAGRRVPDHRRRRVRLRRRLEPVLLRLHPLPAEDAPAGCRSRCSPASAASCPAACWRSPARPSSPPGQTDGEPVLVHRPAAERRRQGHAAGDLPRRRLRERAQRLLRRDVVHGPGLQGPARPCPGDRRRGLRAARAARRQLRAAQRRRRATRRSC